MISITHFLTDCHMNQMQKMRVCIQRKGVPVWSLAKDSALLERSEQCTSNDDTYCSLGKTLADHYGIC